MKCLRCKIEKEEIDYSEMVKVLSLDTLLKNVKKTLTEYIQSTNGGIDPVCDECLLKKKEKQPIKQKYNITALPEALCDGCEG